MTIMQSQQRTSFKDFVRKESENNEIIAKMRLQNKNKLTLIDVERQAKRLKSNRKENKNDYFVLATHVFK